MCAGHLGWLLGLFSPLGNCVFSSEMERYWVGNHLQQLSLDRLSLRCWLFIQVEMSEGFEITGVNTVRGMKSSSDFCRHGSEKEKPCIWIRESSDPVKMDNPWGIPVCHHSAGCRNWTYACVFFEYTQTLHCFSCSTLTGRLTFQPTHNFFSHFLKYHSLLQICCFTTYFFAPSEPRATQAERAESRSVSAYICGRPHWPVWAEWTGLL